MRHFFDGLDRLINRYLDTIGNVLFVLVSILAMGLIVLTLYDGLKPKPEAVPVPVQVETVQAPQDAVLELARANGFAPTRRVVNAIVRASETYSIDVLELTAIGIVETGLGKYAKTRRNRNGTYDKGLFQINTVNVPYCIEYNLDSAEGSALCAAKLLARIKKNREDYLGVYHSKTPSKKALYERKLSNILSQGDTK